MILNDFEPVVDEIAERKLWYNTTPAKPRLMDYIVFLTLLFSFIWYPYWFIKGEQNIVAEVLNGLSDGIVSFLLSIIKVTIGTFAPVLVNIFLMRKYPNMKLPLKYIREFVTRPTRGSYTEGLPFWFLSIPLLMKL